MLSRLWIGFPGVRNLYVDTKNTLRYLYVIWKQSYGTLIWHSERDIILIQSRVMII